MIWTNLLRLSTTRPAVLACFAIVTPAWACFVPPPTLSRDPVSLIASAHAIALVKVLSNPADSLGCLFRPLRYIKGDSTLNIDFNCRLPHGGDWMTTFNWHKDAGFSGRLGVTANCAVIPPAFEIGHTYLLFIGIEPDLKEAEEVRANDGWLLFVEKHVSLHR
jgi:hypothetical protein